MYPLFVHIMKRKCKSNAYLLPIYHPPSQHWYMYMCANILSNNFVFFCGHTLIKCICRSGIQPTTFQIWKQLIDQRSSLLDVTLAPHKKNKTFSLVHEGNTIKKKPHRKQPIAHKYSHFCTARLLFLDEKRKLVAELLFFWRKEKW